MVQVSRVLPELEANKWRKMSPEISQKLQADQEIRTDDTKLEKISSRVSIAVNGHKAHEAGFSHPLQDTPTNEQVVVDFTGPDDPFNPINWPFNKKFVCTLMYGLITTASTFASSVYSPAVDPIRDQYGVNKEVSTLGITFLLIGYGFGPMMWAPISEYYGRKPAVLWPFLIGGIFSFATASSKDIQSILITRFFTGWFASAPLVNTGAVMRDLWDYQSRAIATNFYAFAVEAGILFGPIIGVSLVASGVSWRWTEYITGIVMVVLWGLSIFIVEESYPPVLLKYKAERLRLRTGNWALHAKHEEWDPSFKELAIRFGIRPLRMLITPICFFVAIYASFVYGLLYASLAAIPILFTNTRGWGEIVGSLPFLAFFLGIVLGGAINVGNQFLYNRKIAANGGKPIPEARLPPMMVGSVAIAGGLFILGWTSTPLIHWLVPNIGCVLVGFGFFLIFQAALNYLVDCFGIYAASAMAANTLLRSIFACAFPLFIDPMYKAIGNGWATSVFGFIAVAMLPIPYVFYTLGSRIRKMGKYSIGDDET